VKNKSEAKRVYIGTSRNQCPPSLTTKAQPPFITGPKQLPFQQNINKQASLYGPICSGFFENTGHSSIRISLTPDISLDYCTAFTYATKVQRFCCVALLLISIFHIILARIFQIMHHADQLGELRGSNWIKYRNGCTEWYEEG
jgi:hypothetical protein